MQDLADGLHDLISRLGFGDKACRTPRQRQAYRLGLGLRRHHQHGHLWPFALEQPQALQPAQAPKVDVQQHHIQAVVRGVDGLLKRARFVDDRLTHRRQNHEFQPGPKHSVVVDQQDMGSTHHGNYTTSIGGVEGGGSGLNGPFQWRHGIPSIELATKDTERTAMPAMHFQSTHS